MQQAQISRQRQQIRFARAAAIATYVLSLASVCAAIVQLTLGGVSEVLVKWTQTIPLIAAPMVVLAAVVALTSSDYGLFAASRWSGARIALFVLVATGRLASVSLTAVLFAVYLLDAHQGEHVTVFLLAVLIAVVPFVAAGVGTAQTTRFRSGTTEGVVPRSRRVLAVVLFVAGLACFALSFTVS